MQPDQIADFLQAERVARGLNLQQFTKLVCMSNKCIMAILYGNSSPRLATIARIADLLGYDLDIQFIKRQ